MKRQRGNRVVKHAAADKVIIPVGNAAVQQLPVVCDDPAQPQPRQREHLGHTADGHPLLRVQVNDGIRPRVLLRQMAIHLVAHDPCIHIAGNFHNLLQQFPAHQCAGGVIGVIDADDLGVRGGQLSQLLQIRQIAVFLCQMQQLHICAEGLGNGIKLLVGRHNADDPIARLHQRVKHMVVGPGRTVGGDNLLRTDGPIQLADALPQAQPPLDVAVGQAFGGKLMPEGSQIRAGEPGQFLHGNGVHAGFGDVVAGAHLIFIHPLFYLKGFDTHTGMLLSHFRRLPKEKAARGAAL